MEAQGKGNAILMRGKRRILWLGDIFIKRHIDNV